MNDIEERRARVRSLTRAGVSARLIAEQLHVTPRTVNRDRAALGIAKEPAREVTPAQWVAIKALLDEECSAQEVGRTVGVHPETIRRRFPEYTWDRAKVAEYGVIRRRAVCAGVG